MVRFVFTKSKEVSKTDQETETLLTDLDLPPDIEYEISGFCKIMLKQLGQKHNVFDNSQLRLFMYRQGNNEEEIDIAMNDFYTDYAAALATLEDVDENDRISDTGWEEDDQTE